MEFCERALCLVPGWGGHFIARRAAIRWCVTALLVFSSLARAQNATPQAVSSSPASASGLTQTYTFSFSDPDGATDLGVVNILINDFLDGNSACYLAYARSINVLYLVNDAGNALLPGLVLNGAGSVGNSQCSVAGAGSSVSASGNTLQLTLAMTFSQSFQGRRIIYMAARDAVEANSGWQPLGVHAVPGGSAFPKVTSVSPSSGSGAEQTFTVVYEDATSAANLGPTQLLVNSALDGRQACYVAYSPQSNAIFLVDDAGNAGGPFAGGFVLGTQGASATNTRCTVLSDGSSVTTTGATLTLQLNLRFTPAFNGPRILYAAAQTATGGNTGWQALGAWMVGGGGSPALLSVNPAGGQAGQSLNVAVTGQNTSFQQGVTQVSFGAGVTVGSVSVNSPTSLTAAVTVQAGASPGQRTVTVTTGNEVVNKVAAFTVSSLPPPVISDFGPKTGSSGTAISLTGANLAAASLFPQVFLAKQGGGTISAPVVSATANSLGFVVPPGAATGKVTVTVAGQSTTSSQDLAIVASSSFTLSANPGAVDLIKGQTAAFSIDLTSNNGFTQLAGLSVAGMPAGVTYGFKPEQISSGQTAILEVQAPANQASGLSALTITASSVVDGINLTSSAQATLNVVPITTSFVGRTVVDDTLQTSLAGVTVTMLGKNGNGQNTGCSGQTVSDSAGNFALTGLPATCAGPQLVGFDGMTATSPPGDYAGVNLIYTLAVNQVTASPVLVHLPRIDDKEVFFINQNSSETQTYDFTTIPGLSVTVYPGTTFVAPDGTQPNPFPLIASYVPPDRLPDAKEPVPTMMNVWLVSFSPANTTASAPVAVSYPNAINTPPGTNMVMMTLDPTQGKLVPYGTGTVSNDGLKIVPDPDPAAPGRRYGIRYFDWHAPMPPPPPDSNPSEDPNGPTEGGAVDLSSGIEAFSEVDMVLRGTRGTIALTRTYRSLSNLVGPFGIGTDHNYNYRLDLATPQNAQVLNLIMPFGNRIPFTRQGNNLLVNFASPSMRGAVMKTNSDGTATLRWKDGAVYHFEPGNALIGSVLVGIEDRNKNLIRIVRDGTNPARITEIVDPVGRKLTFTYDSANRITSVTDPIGRQVLYAYNSQGGLATVTDPGGGVIRYSYERVVATVPAIPSGGGCVSGLCSTSSPQMIPCPGLSLTTVTNQNGIVSFRNTYGDGDGGIYGLTGACRVVQQEHADGSVWKFRYETFNPLVLTSPVSSTRVTDPLGRSTLYRFNPQGYVTSVVDPTGQDRVFERQPQTNLVTSITGNGNCDVCGDPTVGDVAFTYDQFGNLLSQTDALGNTIQYTYELQFHNVLTKTDPFGEITQFTYDSNGNLTSITDPKGDTSSFAYNQVGQVTSNTDDAGQTRKFEYDTAGNLVRVVDELGAAVDMTYDAISRITTVRDPLGNQGSLAYNARNQITTSVDARGFSSTVTYDAVGNTISVTDGRGNSVGFTYDAVNRVVRRTDPLGNFDTFTYSLAGTLTESTDRKGQTTRYTYDPLNRTLQAAFHDGSNIRYKYDAAGRMIEAVDSDAGAFQYVYDAAGGLLQSRAPVGVVNYTLDAARRVRTRQVAGQPTLTYSYDVAGNLVSAAYPTASVSMAYDGRGLLTQMTRSNGVTTTNAFDPTGRRISLTHSLGQAALFSQVMSYDAAGNRVSAAISHAQALITQAATAEYNAANQLTRFGATTYTYDKNGNRLTESGPSGTTDYAWDARDRLKSIRLPNGDAFSFTYDYMNQLIQQRRVVGGVETTEQYVLDDWANVVYRTIGGDQTSYITGRYFDRLYGAVGSSGQAFTITDASGSIAGWADGAGSVFSRSAYGPYGQTGALAGQPDAFQYTGRLRITGDLYYYRSRFYDATTARFLSEDPIGLTGGLNQYRYADGDPLAFGDPLGLKSDWLDDFQTALDVLGLVPGFGEPIDGLNALIYLGRGQYGNAALSAGAMIPVIGSVGTGGKLAGKAASKIPDGAVRNLVKKGEAGGPGAGKRISKSTGDAVRAEANDTCVFCGVKTTRTPGPNQSNIDHAIPKSRGGNNTLANAQNTCRTCNLQKGAQTSEEFLRNR